ncbi:IS5 family transposase [Chromobacterium piscinae]|uniref:IS5 family transposase n=1 Tax=Chromobacterium piscinae TaxID=686831 RepID=UPI001E63EDE2|nr:IS5 family transposase [Chromobacterium piscinae]MCD4505158.1 IS5 family transposase [Chromobacterium piscinae]
MSFSDLEQTAKKKQTRREIFLAEMDQVMPWAQLEAVIEPVYPKAGNGRRPYLLASMLRIYCLQQWYSLSDPAMEEALYEIASMRRFAGIDLNRVPDETTMLNFRHLLEEHKLTQALFDVINKHLADKGLLLKQGTIVDATLIHAPSSTKNASGERDPEMHQTKKGNQWYFGMKAPIGVDAHSGLVHHVEGTAANVADVTMVDRLLHGTEAHVFGDAGFTGVEKRDEHRGRVTRWWIAMKPGKRKALTHSKDDQLAELGEIVKAKIRAKVEHPFRIIKRQLGHTKTRYRGLAKNTAQLFMLFGLANIWMKRKMLASAA